MTNVSVKTKLPETVSTESIENRSIVFGNCPRCRPVGTLAIDPNGPHSLNLNRRPILNRKEMKEKDGERESEKEKGKRGNKNEIQ